MSLLVVVILLVLLVGVLPTWPHSANWGYMPSGGLGLIIFVLLILLLMGRL
jgi:Protein of unknown function (DUF3309)